MPLKGLPCGAPSDASPLAVLSLAWGQLHILTDSALQLVLQTEIAHNPTDSVDKPTAIGDRMDGHTAQEWAAYARKKSAIASSVCRLNGVLRRRLAAELPDREDAMQAQDPWLNANFVPTPPADDAGDQWSAWKPALPRHPAGHHDLEVDTTLYAEGEIGDDDRDRGRDATSDTTQNSDRGSDVTLDKLQDDDHADDATPDIQQNRTALDTTQLDEVSVGGGKKPSAAGEAETVRTQFNIDCNTAFSRTTAQIEDIQRASDALAAKLEKMEQKWTPANAPNHGTSCLQIG